VLLNPDIVVTDDALAEFMLRGSVLDGAFYFPALLNRDGTVQHHKKAWPNFMYQCLIVLCSYLGIKLSTRSGNDWAFAAAVCFTRATFRRIGGFDTGFGLYCEDVEIAHRLQRMGGRLVFLEDIALIHGLGGEAKSKYLKKAIVSNFYLRYAYIRNAFLKRAW
jgi:GT2 family glycosyltransferase